MRKTRKLAVGSALGVLTLISVASSATAGDWQALHGVAATPMTSAQMQAVQGKMIVIDQSKNMSAEDYVKAWMPSGATCSNTSCEVSIGDNTAYFVSTGGSLNMAFAKISIKP